MPSFLFEANLGALPLAHFKQNKHGRGSYALLASCARTTRADFSFRLHPHSRRRARLHQQPLTQLEEKITTTLYAQPYDISAEGFYFTNAEEYDGAAATLKNSYGDPVEEFEIQFIDGDDIDCELAKAFELYQGTIGKFFDAVEDWDENEKTIFIFAVGECGYSYDPKTTHPNDFDVELYQLDSLKELAEQFVEDGLYGEIPESLQFYIDTDAMARDLAVDYGEATIAGERLIYRCA